MTGEHSPGAATPAAAEEQGYRVLLPVFEGPLDLLLRLIEQQQLDISAVSLAQVTGQFLEYVRSLESLQADLLADFLTMAARLVYIKSRLLLPPASRAADEEEEDPGEALARQLREYKLFKQAAAALRALEELGRHSYVRVAAPPQLERHLVPGEASIADLLAAVMSAFAPEPLLPPLAGVVAPFTVTIRDQIRLIRHTIMGGSEVSFLALIRRAGSRQEVVVTLLAVLELIKRREVSAVQSGLFGDITIGPAPVGEAPTPADQDGQG